jgi:hypothetical protein
MLATNMTLTAILTLDWDPTNSKLIWVLNDSYSSDTYSREIDNNLGLVEKKVCPVTLQNSARIEWMNNLECLPANWL